MPRAQKKMQRFLTAARNVPWDELVVILRYHGFVVEQDAGKPSHWPVYYPELPDTPILIIATHGGSLKPKYRSRIRRLVQAVLESLETEED